MIKDLFPKGNGTCSHFPCWNDPDPFAYTWTPPPDSIWHQLFGGGAIGDVVNFISGLCMSLIATWLHIAILFASFLSNPAWILDPVAEKIGTVLHTGYDNVFVRFIPLMLLITVVYVVWQYVKGHHAKILKGIISTVLSTALIAFFFWNFGTSVAWLNKAGSTITTDLATGIAKTAGSNVGAEYDAIWNAYVLFPWEYGQFGQVSAKIEDFNVTGSIMGKKYKDDADQKHQLSSGDNWVSLFLHNTGPDARGSLVQLLNDDTQPMMTGQLAGTTPKAVNPYMNFGMVLIEGIFLLPAVVFLINLGFQLFIRECWFLLTLFMGIVTVPMAFVPEIGWTVTARWIREALSHMVERLANVMYGAIVLAFAGIITEVLANAFNMGIFLAMIVNGLIFAAATFYRTKVFSLWVHPVVDRVKYGYGPDQSQQQNTGEGETDSYPHAGRSPREKGKGNHHRGRSPRIADRFRASTGKKFEATTRGGGSTEQRNQDQKSGSSRLKSAAIRAALTVATDGAYPEVEGAAKAIRTASADLKVADLKVPSSSPHGSAPKVGVRLLRSGGEVHQPVSSSRIEGTDANARGFKKFREDNPNPITTVQPQPVPSRTNGRAPSNADESGNSAVNSSANGNAAGDQSRARHGQRDPQSGKFVSKIRQGQDRNQRKNGLIDKGRAKLAEHAHNMAQPSPSSTWEQRARGRENFVRRLENFMTQKSVDVLTSVGMRILDRITQRRSVRAKDNRASRVQTAERKQAPVRVELSNAVMSARGTRPLPSSVQRSHNQGKVYITRNAARMRENPTPSPSDENQ